MDERDQRIIAYIDSRAEEQLHFLIDLCDQNSFTDNKSGVDRVAAMILERLAGMLPVHQTIDQHDRGSHHLLRSYADGNAIYLIGHLDTVFPPDHPFQQCRIDGDRLLGPGTGDMKGGLVVFVYALKALQAAGLLDQLHLALILNGDEEAGSITSRTLIEQERTRAVACLCGECAGPSGEIVVSRNGKSGARIDCFGAQRHIGRETHAKASAILELARRIMALESLNAVLPGVSVNVGKVEGGLGPATVPARASALVDIRWVQEEHRATLLERVEREISSPSPDGCRSELRVLNSRPAWPRHVGSDAILDVIQRVGGFIGQSILPEHRRGTSDANFFGSIGIPTIDGIGPICEGDHTPGEFIRIPSLGERTVLLALSLIRMVAGSAEEQVP